MEEVKKFDYIRIGINPVRGSVRKQSSPPKREIPFLAVKPAQNVPEPKSLERTWTE